MSKFTTRLPVDVEGVIKTLPKGYHLHGVRMGDDGRSLVMEWEHDHLRTPFTVPVEIPAAALAGKEPLPESVKLIHDLATLKTQQLANQQVCPTETRQPGETAAAASMPRRVGAPGLQGEPETRKGPKVAKAGKVSKQKRR